MMDSTFPEHRRHLKGLIARLRKRIPGTLSGFVQLHEESMKDGALSERQKELIALGIGISTRCDGCIAFHTREALEQGATSEEIADTIGVAIMMGGGPSLMYGALAFEALEQFEAERQPSLVAA